MRRQGFFGNLADIPLVIDFAVHACEMELSGLDEDDVTRQKRASQPLNMELDIPALKVDDLVEMVHVFMEFVLWGRSESKFVGE